MERHVDGRALALTHGDITRVEADAIVNAANSGLRGGGGVDGAIHRAGGRSIMEECRRIGGCPTGSALATGAGQLPARHVIHAVAPIWRGGEQSEPELLRGAYRRSLQIADELGLESIAFPSLGTGAYGYPVDPAAHIALQTAIDHLHGETGLRRITFVLFSGGDLETYQKALEELTRQEGE